MPGPKPTFSDAQLREMARLFVEGWSTYQIAEAYDTSQYLVWRRAVDRFVPLDHPRRRGRRGNLDYRRDRSLLSR